MLDLSKLKDETLADVLESSYGKIEVSEGVHTAFGGSTRKEFTLMFEGGPVQPTCTSVRSAMEFAVKQLIRLESM